MPQQNPQKPIKKWKNAHVKNAPQLYKIRFRLRNQVIRRIEIEITVIYIILVFQMGYPVINKIIKIQYSRIIGIIFLFNILGSSSRFLGFIFICLDLNKMGNIIDKITQDKTSVLAGLTAAGLITYVVNEALVKKSQRNKILEAVRNQIICTKENTNDLYLNTPIKQYWLRSNPKYPVYKIVVTGGPCGGKSSSFDRIRKVFTEKGFRVLCVPEINTMVVLGGAAGLIPRLSNRELLLYETYLIRFQMFAEDYFTKLAQMANMPAIVLCDRGTMDAYAYMTNESFQAVLDQEGWTLVQLRDKRYDLVCFLSSAANGAEKYYTTENNAARSEGLQLARYLDKRTLQAWTGHPHVVVAPNLPSQTFNDKINRVIQAVRNMVGQELHTLVNHKILIKQPIFPPEVKHEISEIQQIFLMIEDPRCKQNKLKKRGTDFSFTYYQKFIFKTQHEDYTQQLRRQLIPKQYMAMKETKADRNYDPVVRTRIDFIWNNFSYCIDIYNNVGGHDKAYLLRFFARKGEAENFIPPFIEAIKDVYSDPAYKLANIAKRKNPVEE